MTKLVNKKVNLTDLKARLSEHVRHVRKGESIIVTQNDLPVARLIPYESFPVEKPKAEGVKLQLPRREFELMTKASPVTLPKPKQFASDILLEIRKERF